MLSYVRKIFSAPEPEDQELSNFSEIRSSDGNLVETGEEQFAKIPPERKAKLVSGRPPSAEKDTEDSKWKVHYKVIVLGDVNTGHTALIKKAVNDMYIDSYRSTIGVDKE